ncbi:hypothetical protein M5689_024584 [Euphorbia peplus]|nr:hypothetical protein M5689_024584 [Euphorbia peplus]
MILRQMKGLKPNGTLAYGSLLTRVFESVGVDFPADAIRSRSTAITYGPLSKLVFDQLPSKKGATSVAPVIREVHKNVVKGDQKVSKKNKGKKKVSCSIEITVEKNSAKETVPNLVQTRISVAPYGKVCAEKPSEAAEKTAQEIEDEHMAELARVAETEKLKAVIQQVEMNKRADVDMNKRAGVDMNKRADVDMNKRADVNMNKRAETTERENAAKAKAKADARPVSEADEEDAPLSRKRTYRTKASAAMRKPMRRSDFDFEIHPDPNLEDDTAETGETVRGKIVSDEEDTHMDDDEEHFNDDGAPVFENVSDDSSPEPEDPENVLEDARVFAQNVDSEHFIDDVLLGQGRSN